MGNRLLATVLILGSMLFIFHGGVLSRSETPHSTLVLGFLLLAAYALGYFGELAGLPRITGYIIAGLVLGPHLLRLISTESIANLNFLNSLALAFIAFSAGGELKYASIRERFRSIAAMLAGTTVVVFGGIAVTVLLISPLIPFLGDQPFSMRLAVAAIIGVISTARSPSSAIAVISETKAEGPYTEMILSVTVAVDVVVIMLFAVVISVSHVLIKPGSNLDVVLMLHLVVELSLACALGFMLGKGIIYLVRRIEVELPVIIVAMGFVVIKFCHLLSQYFSDVHSISLNLEPLLICMAAGFTVQNGSEHGRTFLRSMDRVSLPIYVAFFAITGATINLDVLQSGWLLGVIIVVARGAALWGGAYGAAKLADEPTSIRRNAWLGYLTQAGVSLGLVAEVVRRFPEMGVHLQSILIASITVNQIIGPVAFKYALRKTGEARAVKTGSMSPPTG